MVAPVVALVVILVVAVVVIGIAWLGTGSKRHVSPAMAKAGRQASAYLNGDAQVDWSEQVRLLARLRHRAAWRAIAGHLGRIGRGGSSV